MEGRRLSWPGKALSHNVLMLCINTVHIYTYMRSYMHIYTHLQKSGNWGLFALWWRLAVNRTHGGTILWIKLLDGVHFVAHSCRGMLAATAADFCILIARSTTALYPKYGSNNLIQTEHVWKIKHKCCVQFRFTNCVAERWIADDVAVSFADVWGCISQLYCQGCQFNVKIPFFRRWSLDSWPARPSSNFSWL